MTNNPTRYQPGETLRITLPAAIVRDITADGVIVEAAGQCITIPAAAADIVRVIPVEGEPQYGDLWTSQFGVVMLAVAEPNRMGVYLRSPDGTCRAWEQVHQHRVSGPIRLYHRPPQHLPVSDHKCKCGWTVDVFTAPEYALRKMLDTHIDPANAAAARHDRGQHDDCDPATCPAAEALIAQLHGEDTEPFEGEHKVARGWGGVPGECGMECACGVTYDGFDSLAEAGELLDAHIAEANSARNEAQQEPDAPISERTTGDVIPSGSHAYGAITQGTDGVWLACCSCAAAFFKGPNRDVVASDLDGHIATANAAEVQP